jgi:serine/threonine-protein kinase HipA
VSAFDRVEVLTDQRACGELSQDVDRDYLFRYGIGMPVEAQISLTMAVRDMPYLHRTLHPVFQMNLPEGYVLEQLRHRLAKTTTLNPMLLLALTGSGSPIGRVRVQSPALDTLLDRGAMPRGERLADLLAWDGAADLFTQLVDKYILRAGISGIQPKVLVPEDRAADPNATLMMPELIVKAGREDFPGLAINEFLCMDAARRAGMPVPEFFLSDNHKLFVMRRFDRGEHQQPLGFEDMAVLTGVGTEEKYNASYEKIARAIRLFCAPQQVRSSLRQFFDIVALSCMVGNGDAHLKNFGLLYADPLGGDAALSPAYDIVNTTAYIPEDSLALTLAGSKSLFRSRLGILDLAKTCDVVEPRKRLRELVAAVEASLSANAVLAEKVPQVAAAMAQASGAFRQTFAG